VDLSGHGGYKKSRSIRAALVLLFISVCFRQAQKSTARLCGTNRRKQMNDALFA